jgi:flagellar protein FlgJ
MASSNINSATYTDFNGLAGLKRGAQKPDEDTLREIARQFEAMFVQMMLKNMREAKIGEGLFDSQEGELYQDLFDKQLSLDMSKHPGIGLAEIMVRQLKGALPPASGAPAGLQMGAPLRPAMAAAAPAPLTSAPAQWKVEDKADFVNKLWPHAQRTAAKLGTTPESLIAQAALETGWGTALTRGADGQASFNFFNIKADSSWQGERVVQNTLEVENGELRRTRAAFRAYPDVASAFDDYAAFIRDNPRYGKALEAGGDGRRYIAELHKAGYATDPGYAGKIHEIMGSAAVRPQPDRSSTGQGRPL